MELLIKGKDKTPRIVITPLLLKRWGTSFQKCQSIMRHCQGTTQKFWEDDVLRKWKKIFCLSLNFPAWIHGALMVSSPSMKMGRFFFQGQLGVYVFIWTTSYEGVIFRDYSRRTPPPFSCPIGKCRVQVLKVNLTNHREVCRTKFYQILTSN